ncbi:MAG: YihY/virulence factor BrkB family protein [Pyrinomonadaceae bacterium MAG19_C2-C3]|nr:YihY/virulence factor BrkB family protein [Pyrinomonadaceae bacterium MAG19_C2-C3]
MALFDSLSLRGLTIKELGKRVFNEANSDDIWGHAAQLSYYFLLALFPLLLFLTAMLGYLVGEDSQLRDNLLGYLGQVLPGDAYRLVRSTVIEVTQASSGSKISFGILAAIWAASNGMGAICDTLNSAYNVKESRPWWKARLVAIGLTISIAVLIISALALILYGHNIAAAIARRFRLSQAFESVWGILQYPVVIFFVLLAFGIIYYFAPNLKTKSWKWITPGAVVGVTLWLLVSFGFNLYLSYFNSYSATYGTLGAVIILMLWFYFTGLAILIGGEVNSELENAAAESGDPTAKKSGEKAPGEMDAAVEACDTKETRPAPATAAAHHARTAHTTHTPPNTRTRREPLTIGKVALVAGSWLVSKVTRSRK